MSELHQITAFAPASVGNVAVGFDVLGHAISGCGDKVTATKTGRKTVSMGNVSGCILDLPTDPEKNTAGKAVLSLLAAQKAVQKIDFGIKLDIEKGIPLGSGLGGSAASAVAAVVAVNALLDKPLPIEKLYPFALDGEAVASGARHGDNVAPALLGGLVLLSISSGGNEVPIKVKIPNDLYYVCLHPDIRIDTSASRKLLPAKIPLGLTVEYARNLASLILGCERSDYNLIAGALVDNMIEPARASLIPGFDQIQAAAMSAGGLGCSISGSGPNIFAWIKGEELAGEVLRKMKAAAPTKYQINTFLGPVNTAGAQIIASKTENDLSIS